MSENLDSTSATERHLGITTLRDGDAAVIVLTGELDLAVAGELDAAIRDAEGAPIGRIIVDLSQITFVDSTGLSVLLAAKKRVNGRLSISPSNHDAVTRLLELTRTTEILAS